MPKKEPFNPFYIILLVLGVCFFITACAYGLMMLRANQTISAPGQPDSGQGLLAFMEQHGMWLLASEVVLLGLATVAAITLDHCLPRSKNAATVNQKNSPNHREITS